MQDETDSYARPVRAKNDSGARGGARHIQPGNSPKGRRAILRNVLLQSEGAIDFDYLGMDCPYPAQTTFEETTPGEVYPLMMMALAVPVISDQISSDGELGIVVADGSPWLIGDLGAVRLLNKIALTDQYPDDIDPETLKLRRNDG